jgi:hypothetical protein
LNTIIWRKSHAVRRMPLNSVLCQPLKEEVKRASLAVAETKTSGPKVDEVKRLVAIWENCRLKYEEQREADRLHAQHPDAEHALKSLRLIKEYTKMLESAKAATDSADL